MSLKEAAEYLSSQMPCDILCLGSNSDSCDRTNLQNLLEDNYPDKFNKNTLWSAIDEKGRGRSTEPKASSAIFTTFDGSKGLERKICVVCDFSEKYWNQRASKPLVKYEILRNIFLVGISRGKEKIIFIRNKSPLTEKTLSTPFKTRTSFRLPLSISKAFDYKYEEDIEKTYRLLVIQKIQDESNSINITLHDGLIDISPCVGEFVEASYFSKYNIDSQIEYSRQFTDYSVSIPENGTVQEKILGLTALTTGQSRYIKAVRTPYVSKDQEKKIQSRLSERLKKDEEEQVECYIGFSDKDNGIPIVKLQGRCDVIKDDKVYELKFVGELQHTHFLQLACYLVALGKKTGYLWNVRNNEIYSVEVPDEIVF